MRPEAVRRNYINELTCASPDVAVWPDAEAPVDGRSVRLLGHGGKHLLVLRITESDPQQSFARASSCKRWSHNRLPSDLFDRLVGDGEQARENQE
jgi:hypothetical protein